MSHRARRRRRVALVLATAFRDGVWVADRMSARGAHDLGVEHAPWMHTVAQAVVAEFASAPHDAARELTARVERLLEDAISLGVDDVVLSWIHHGPIGRRGLSASSDGSSDAWAGPATAVVVPVAMGARRWDVPEIDTVGALADFFALQPNELEWYADVRSLERTAASEDLRHYTYTWRTKRRGGARLLEAPKQNLKAIQRKLLRQILRPLPAHEAAHGFVPGRSIQTYAREHTGKSVLIRMDLRSFFPTVPAGRLFGTFRTLGYAEEVAHMLTGLVTNATPNSVIDDWPRSSEREALPGEVPWLRGPHLPQGSPTSPHLSNLAAFGLDRRLSALAASFDATYTRYADDLAFSGGDRLARRPDGLLAAATEIVHDEGFFVNGSKTAVRTRTQRQSLTGLVVNDHLNVHRRDYDRLKAVLHDAATNGVAAANRGNHPAFRSHLEGRIGFVQATNPSRARKLWRLFDAVDWPS